jgi:hypothetical protein
MHCMYACSHLWDADWLSEGEAARFLGLLAGKIRPCPGGSGRIGINCGFHITGGEPFLNFDLLLKITRLAHELEIPSVFVETNCFWCIDNETARSKLTALEHAGLHGVLISVNPFILGQVPFEQTQRGVEAAEEIFGDNVLVYQRLFYDLFKHLGIKGTLSFDEFLFKASASLQYVELLPMGRTVYKLGGLFRKYPAKRFFGSSCREDLTRGWHIHIDNYGNYVPGYCGGISLGDAGGLDSLLQGIDLKERPIIGALATDIERLYEFAVDRFEYEEANEGYISKCHLCVDLRRHIAGQTDRFAELSPRQYYHHLE